MNGWVKCACLAVSTMLFVDCNASKNVRHESSKTHSIDSLPPTIIQPNSEEKNAILSTDSTSKIGFKEATLLTQLILMDKLETEIFDTENAKFFKLQGLPHVEIQDLQIAVDDYGIINYLNPDF